MPTRLPSRVDYSGRIKPLAFRIWVNAFTTTLAAFAAGELVA
jgi:hypothetical protein